MNFLSTGYWVASLSMFCCMGYASEMANRTSSANTGAYFEYDGPPAHTPVNLDLLPDATPQDEPLIKSANLPYSALGMSFRPTSSDAPYKAQGVASWYGRQFHGRRTMSGERYNMFAMTGAHPTLPIPCYVRVTHLKNGRSVVVRINDRGPFHPRRILDVSYAAAHKLGFVKQGSARVRIERVWPNEQMGMSLTSLKQEDSKKYLQLGAFNLFANAEALIKEWVGRLEADGFSKLDIINQQGTYKVRLGPFDSVNKVRMAAESLNVETVVVD